MFTAGKMSKQGSGSVMSSLCRAQTRAASYQGPRGEKHSAMFCKARATMPPTGHKHADTHKDELSFAPVLSPDLDPVKLFFIQKKNFPKTSHLLTKLESRTFINIIYFKNLKNECNTL